MHAPTPTPKLSLHSTRPRRLLILLQLDQQLTETRLTATHSAATGALTADVDEAGNALPAGAASGGVFAGGEEGLCLGAGTLARLVDALVISLIVVVDVRVGLGNGGGLAVGGKGGTAGDVGVAAGSPFAVRGGRRIRKVIETNDWIGLEDWRVDCAGLWIQGGSQDVPDGFCLLRGRLVGRKGRK